MLNIKNCTFTYNPKRQPVISDLSLQIREGGVYGLLGSNGTGKSTLLNLACGLLTPNEGEIDLDGINVRRRLPRTMADLYIVPEEITLPSCKLSSYVATTACFYPKFEMELLRQHLQLFDIPESIHLGHLSMGQKKKIALAFAMACNTKLLLMDEPTNGLDIPGKSAFRRFIASSMSDDRIFIISTHQVRDVSQILDNVLIMNNGKIMLDQPVSEIQSRLLFGETTDSGVAAKAFYSEKTFGGYAVVLPNTTNADSELNLELLFEMAVEKPELIKHIFSKDN